MFSPQRKKIFPLTMVSMEPCLETIYKFRNHASSRRDYHPSAELGIAGAILRADSGNGCTRIP
jgi:hypothetical protein